MIKSLKHFKLYMSKRESVKYRENALDYGKSVELRKLEKNARTTTTRKCKDVEARAA